VAALTRENGAARIHVDSEDAMRPVLRLLVDNGITTVRTSLPSLEEVYLGLIGKRGLEV
jgi:ABC-2 type transport system ATP-binding protein